MSNGESVDWLEFVKASARVWRRKEAEAEAAREALNSVVVSTVKQHGHSQRDVARAAQISEPLVRKIIANHTEESS